MRTRDLSRVVATALEVPGVERFAARLVRDGWLPRAGEPSDEVDAATLLLAVLGTDRPEQASEAVETLMGLPRRQVSKNAMTGLEWWFAATDEEADHFPPTLGLQLASVLECQARGIERVRPTLMTLARDGSDVSIWINIGFVLFRVDFGSPGPEPAGMRIFTSISEPVFKAVGAGLKTKSFAAPGMIAEGTMQSVAMH